MDKFLAFILFDLISSNSLMQRGKPARLKNDAAMKVN